MANKNDTTVRALRWIAIALLVIIALWSRAPAPWRSDVTNDEMLHLESWRNHYRTDNIYPMFLQRLEKGGHFSSREVELGKRVYHSSPLVQRGLLMLVDLHPPLFPALLETIEATTRSNLLVARFPAMLASLATVLVMYLLGRELGGPVLGLWCAGLNAISLVNRVYAGFARPQALAALSLALFFYVFVRHWKKPAQQRQTLWPLLLAALFAQSMQWMIWPIVGPMMLFELVRQLREGATVRRLAAKSWWYVLGSVLLLMYFAVQMQNPTMNTVTGQADRAQFWREFTSASPFAQVARLGPVVTEITAILPILLTVIGVICVLRRADLVAVRWPLICALAALILPARFYAFHSRFWVTYMVPITVFCGIAVLGMLKERIALGALVAVLLVFGVITVAYPEDPKLRIQNNDGPYRQLAERLKEELKPQDVWAGWPYFTGDNLYRFGPLPEPARLLTPPDLDQWLAAPASGSKYLITAAGASNGPQLIERSRRRWAFRNGFYVLEL